MSTSKQTKSIVVKCAQMWPRAVFDMREGKQVLEAVKKELSHLGVYVLYRDDHPYYIGRSQNLFKRVGGHANLVNGRYHNLWNYFSAYVVHSERHAREVEGILISAMPTAVNSANPRITRIRIPSRVSRKLRQAREWPFERERLSKALTKHYLSG